MNEKQAAVQQIAAKLERIQELLAEANAIAETNELDFDGYEGDGVSEEEEEYDPDGVLFDLRGWNASTC